MKVHPADVDAVVERFPATLDVCSFGFADALLGEDVGVAVVLTRAGDARCAELHAWTARASREPPDAAAMVPGSPRSRARLGAR